MSPAHTRIRSALAALAELLAYPRPEPGATEAALARARRDAPAAAGAALARFAGFVERTGPAEREEAYSATFDLAPKAPPYVGHQLCGESTVRGAFLARLVQIHAAHGFRTEGELPDHLAEVLRFLAVADGQERDELLRDGARVAVERMLEQIDPGDPHRDLLVAAAAVLRVDPGAEAPEPEPARAAGRREVRP
jgi:nitrate reductase delta subunit